MGHFKPTSDYHEQRFKEPSITITTLENYENLEVKIKITTHCTLVTISSKLVNDIVTTEIIGEIYSDQKDLIFLSFTKAESLLASMLKRRYDC